MKEQKIFAFDLLEDKSDSSNSAEKYSNIESDGDHIACGGCGLPVLPGGVELDTKSIRSDVQKRYTLFKKEMEQAKQGGHTHKVWQIKDDDRTRSSHRHMEGMKIPIDDKFNVNGHRMYLPSDTSAPLKETANCRCTVTYEKHATATECEQFEIDWRGFLQDSIDASDELARLRVDFRALDRMKDEFIDSIILSALTDILSYLIDIVLEEAEENLKRYKKTQQELLRKTRIGGPGSPRRFSRRAFLALLKASNDLSRLLVKGVQVILEGLNEVISFIGKVTTAPDEAEKHFFAKTRALESRYAKLEGDLLFFQQAASSVAAEAERQSCEFTLIQNG